MELNIKILDISPNIKTLKIKPTDIISLSLIAENIVVKIDDIEKNILNKENILLILREYSPNEKIHFNLIRNEAIIIGTGKFSLLSGSKWYKIFDLINLTENNINYNNKLLFYNKKNSDSLINSNIKIKLETQINIVNESKSKLKYNTKKLSNYSNNKNKSNITGLISLDEKNNNSIISSNMNSNFNKFRLYQNINSYTATPSIKSPRYNNILMRAKTNNNKTKANNNENNENESFGDKSIKENTILPALDLVRQKERKNSGTRRTPSGKKFLGQGKKYQTLYGFNNKNRIFGKKISNHGSIVNENGKNNMSTEKSLQNNFMMTNNKGKVSKEIEEKILDKNFQDIIKCDEILRGKEITEFNSDNNNLLNTQESNRSKNIENNFNANKNINNNKNINFKDSNKIFQNNNNKENKNIINKNKMNNINSILNTNENKKNNNYENNNQIYSANNKLNNEIDHNNIIINNEVSSNNIKTDINNIIQNSAVSLALSSGRVMNICGGDTDLSGDDLSGSFSAYDNISKILSLDEFKISHDIEIEDIMKYENIKNDFILFYNKEYINSINEEMLILELQLMIDKILEMQNVYKKQSIIIQRNFEKFRKKLCFYQKKNIFLNKKINKLNSSKLKNVYKEEFNDFYYNNKKISFYKNKNIFRINELPLWNNLTEYISEKEINKKNVIKNSKKKFKNIFLIICNKNINNLNTLSKKFIHEFVEKEKKKEEEKEKEKEKEEGKSKENVKLNNTYSNFYNDNKKKSDLMSNSNYNKIYNKNSSKNYFKNNNRNDIKGYQSNKLLKSNDTIFKKEKNKEIFQKQETEGNKFKINNKEKMKKIKFKSNDFGRFNIRNFANKKTFITMKSFSKKFNTKK